MFNCVLWEKMLRYKGGYLTRGVEECTIVERSGCIGPQVSVAMQTEDGQQEVLYSQTGKE